MLRKTFDSILEKAKTKKDGCYSSGIYYYAVGNPDTLLIGNKVTGEMYQSCFGMLVALGRVESFEVKKTLMKMLKARNS